ncbi:MAG: hypothetical protein IPL65_05785 [Lewinellaceae bacterium]|nr:hypothetical protein [Lewinellaceae bacterium]
MKKHFIPVLSGLFFLLHLLLVQQACKPDGRNIKDYYFPVKELANGRVYVFASETGDSSDVEYWYYKSFKVDSGMFLAATYYDRQFVIGQIVREKIVRNGALARNYYLYEPDTATQKVVQLPVEIVAANTFPFVVKDSSNVYLFHVKYHPPGDTATTIYVIRNRRFLGDGPAFRFDGQDYPVIKMNLREVYGNEKEGTLEIKGQGEEWYAKGLGLVYYKKSIADGKYKLAYRLREIISMDELVRRENR